MIAHEAKGAGGSDQGHDWLEDCAESGSGESHEWFLDNGMAKARLKSILAARTGVRMMLQAAP